ncbi:hypothetical protein GMD37_10750, partial [Parasutterella excrementihominis]|uniref:hypothetical protein n=1 Tax=Parasutterella excrementihominis TaxID=487175 RepID=UPI0012BB9715
MAISFKEQIDNFSNDFYINTAYIPYIVNGPECADGLSADELKKIDDFLDKWSYVDCSEAMLDSPDFGECHICGMQAAVTKATFINKEAVREEEQRRETDPFSTPEQQDGGIEPPPVLSSRFFRF